MLSLTLGQVELFSAELCPLDLENFNNVSQEYTGQVQLWFYLNYFQQCYAPCTYVSWC